METEVFTSREEPFNHRLVSQSAASLILWCVWMSPTVMFAALGYFIAKFQLEPTLRLNLVLLLPALALPMLLSLGAAWAIVQRPELLYAVKFRARLLRGLLLYRSVWVRS